MNSAPSRRPAPLVDGVVTGLMITLVLLTIWGFGQEVRASLSTEPAAPGERANRFRLEIDDHRGGDRVDIRIPAGLVESFAGLVGGDATVRLDRELEDTGIDWMEVWTGVKALPEGQSWTQAKDDRQVTARRVGELIEITVVEAARHHDEVTIGDSSKDDDEEKTTDEATTATPKPESAAPAPKPTPPVQKKDDFFGIRVDHGGKTTITGPGAERQTVVVRLPVKLFESMESSGGTRIRVDLGALVRDVRKMGRTEILTVEGPDESVRIAVE